MDKISNKPKNSVIAVTYRCNSRCKMCNIWQIEHGEELSPDVYRKLPAGMDEVNITGGEPFLRSDLVEIVDIIYETCQPKKLVIPTNGFLQDVIIEKAKLFLTKPYKDILTIAVSLDGIGEKHSEIRGIGNAFEKSVGTVKKLLVIGFKNTGFGFTFIPGNEEEYEKVYGLSKELGVNIGVSIAHNSENYFSTDSNEGIDAKKVDEQLSRTIKEKVKTFSKNELGKSFYMHGLIRFANSKEMILPCQAMTDSFFLDPKGDIYPCNILNDRVGNLKEKSFDEIWNSKEAEQARAKAKNCRQKCWMVCTAKPAIKKHWFRTGLWILKEKFKTLRIT